MSLLISRILLTILLFPLAALFNLIVYIIVERNMSSDREVWAASLATAGFIVVYWVLLWRKSVRWTGPRVQKTLLTAAASVIAGCAIGWLVHTAQDYGEISTFCGITAVPLLWIVGTIFYWRETPAERAQRLARVGADTLTCPNCGYNLTGLREARCPECGAGFTLNDLLAAQPNRAAAEIESA